MRALNIYILLSVLNIICSSLKANDSYFRPLSDSSRISILTNDPSNEAIYTLFGHTVIRIQDKEQNIDLAFNYGVFDFNAPNFVGRFIKGETDYSLEAYNTVYYIRDCTNRGVGVTEQELNLTTKDKNNIWKALLINLNPENKIYRYNFLFDNCATRPRNIIEQNVDEKIIYTPTNREQTYRDLIHECVKIDPWNRFGIDLLIGADADKPITDREKDFLPHYLKNAYRGATLLSEKGAKIQLLKSESIIISPSVNINKLPIPADYPLIVGIGLFCMTLIMSYLSYKKGIVSICKVYTIIVFFILGILGSVIFFLMFISVHPCVDNNWNLVWLNPLSFIAICLFFAKPLTKYIYYYHFINFVALLLFLLGWFLIPQQLDMANIPYILSIMLISGTNILINKKQRNLKNIRLQQ